MTTHASILAWKISWTEKPGGPQSMGSQSDTTEHHNNTYKYQLCAKALNTLFCAILIAILQGTSYNYSHFISKEIRA